MSDWIKELDGLCCPADKEIIKEGDKNCVHLMKKISEYDECVHVMCDFCGRVVCWGIWE